MCSGHTDGQMEKQTDGQTGMGDYNIHRCRSLVSQINVLMGILSKNDKRTKPNKRTNSKENLPKINQCTRKA